MATACTCTRGVAGEKRDANFQGFGRFLTGTHGRVLLPHGEAGALPGPHAAHPFQGQAAGEREFTTQCYVKDHPQNERDGVYRGIRDTKARESVTVDFKPMKEAKTGELEARSISCWASTPHQS